jgi:hypothetical protein
MAAEMVLISASVFLGLIGQQWYEDVRQRRDATASLQRFRTEVTANRREITSKLEYHAPLQKRLRAFVRADAAGRQAIDLGFDSVKPPFFERTAWELALATESLAHVDPDLAFVLSRIYTFQEQVNALTRAFTDAMYANPPSDLSEPFLRAADLYFGDLVGFEEGLVQMYDTALMAIDEALAD